MSEATDWTDHVSLFTMTTHNVSDAETHLSRLIDAALDGEDIILTRAGEPHVRLVPITTPAPRELGFVHVSTPDDRFDPLTEDELAAGRNQLHQHHD